MCLRNPKLRYLPCRSENTSSRRTYMQMFTAALLAIAQTGNSRVPFGRWTEGQNVEHSAGQNTSQPWKGKACNSLEKHGQWKKLVCKDYRLYGFPYRTSCEWKNCSKAAQTRGWRRAWPWSNHTRTCGGWGGDGQQSRSVFCLRWWFHERVRCSFKSGELDILPSKSAFYCMIIFRIKIYKRTEGLNGILDTAGKGFMKNVSGTQPREDMSLWRTEGKQRMGQESLTSSSTAD